MFCALSDTALKHIHVWLGTYTSITTYSNTLMHAYWMPHTGLTPLHLERAGRGRCELWPAPPRPPPFGASVQAKCPVSSTEGNLCFSAVDSAPNTPTWLSTPIPNHDWPSWDRA
eukprot:GHVU01010311.1.p6 GENE.GHVU01010311.1~~GHVU01010311.1.p6  ORF type:complete len:114 (-),score=0.46 GHVU01010311.1:1949-2290(-)